jgi:AcrR family transcriptional regulator
VPRAGLDRERVVSAAAEIADREGLTALTLTRVAKLLGVRSPSLYAHVDGLDDLRERVASRGALALAERLSDAAAGRAGRDALFAVAAAYRAYAKECPGSYAALQRVGGRDDEASRRVVGVVLAMLRGYRLTGDDAIHAARAVRAALHGFVLLETDAGFGIPLDLDESFARMVAVLDAGLRSVSRS